MTRLLDELDVARQQGRKLLVPYLMGGLPDVGAFPAALRAVEEHADAVEIGLPFSDPLMDGPVIAAAGERTLAQGTGPLDALALAGEVPAGKPRIVMTYFNPIHRVGAADFCKRASDAGIDGLIVPDLPIEESSELQEAAAAADLAWVPLVAPTSPDERVARIAATATGFVYAVSTLGVTGTRERLSERAERVVEMCRRHTDLPVLVGIGISNAEQAVEAAIHADGVVVGSAVVARILEQGHDSARSLLGEIRAALDEL